MLVGIFSAWLFARGYFISGGLLLQLSASVDCVDGDLARALYKESRLGKWLDLVGDQAVHIAVFAGIGFGVASSDPASPALALGISAVLGTIISFAVIVRLMQRKTAGKSSILEKLIDAATNRDFSLLVLLLAMVGRLDLFLWLAADRCVISSGSLFLLAMAKRTIRTSRSRRNPREVGVKIDYRRSGAGAVSVVRSQDQEPIPSRGLSPLSAGRASILLPYALVYLFDTLGWRSASVVRFQKRYLWKTVPDSVAGESLNNVVLSAYLGGEAVKVYLLHKLGLAIADGAESVIIGKTAQVLSEVIFIAFER